MSTKKVHKIAVLTSGGDAPGMNAAIRAVVRTGLYHGLDVFGVTRGYNGMIEDDIFQMNSKSVANIIQRGGTILKTARSKDFFEPEGRKIAYENLKKRGIDGIVVIGGDGSFKGAQKFSNEFDIPCIGIPGTIDKDIAGSDFTIGFDTAVNTAVEAIDKIRDTADAHDRLFVVEVMGRDAGYIALHSGIATGAENILIPESKTDMEALVANLTEKEKRRKLVNLIVVAEGDEFGGGNQVGDYLKTKYNPNVDWWTIEIKNANNFDFTQVIPKNNRDFWVGKSCIIKYVNEYGNVNEVKTILHVKTNLVLSIDGEETYYN